MSVIEVVALGERKLGEWHNVPACLMEGLLHSDEPVDVFVGRMALPFPPPCQTMTFLAVEDANGVRYYPARPPVVFTAESATIEEMRSRVSEGEDADMVMLEFYANGSIETEEVE